MGYTRAHNEINALENRNQRLYDLDLYKTTGETDMYAYIHKRCSDSFTLKCGTLALVLFDLRVDFFLFCRLSCYHFSFFPVFRYKVNKRHLAQRWEYAFEPSMALRDAQCICCFLY